MSSEPFLVGFAEPVQSLPRPVLAYDAIARRNRLVSDCGPFATAVLVSDGTLLTETREQKDHSEHGSVDAEGTTVTMTCSNAPTSTSLNAARVGSIPKGLAS
jgi:hypothetical protein